MTRFRQQRKVTKQRCIKSEIEYTGYLSPEALKSLPVATTVGNHDADNANYTYHLTEQMQVNLEVIR